MLFLAHYRENQVLRAIEKDQRLTNRVLGCLWRHLPSDEKMVYDVLSEKEKKEHALKYPGYRYQPKPTNQLKKKRNVKRNGPSDLKRCELIADLLLSGIVGDDLVEAVGRLDISVQSGVAPEGGCPAQGRDTDATSAGSVRSTGTVGSPKLDDGSNLSAPKATPTTCDSGPLDVGIAVHGIPSSD